MQFKLKEEELAALIGGQGRYDPLQQLVLRKIFDKDDDKKEPKEDKEKPIFFLGYEIKRRKKESTGSLMLWLMLGLMAFSPYVDILQQYMEKSLKAALQ
jgi:hypothetical protein